MSFISKLKDFYHYSRLRLILLKYLTKKSISFLDKVVVIEILGGLGNQLFQYTAGKLLAKKLNAKLVLYTGEMYRSSLFTKREFNLPFFNIEYDDIIENNKFKDRIKNETHIYCEVKDIEYEIKDIDYIETLLTASNNELTNNTMYIGGNCFYKNFTNRYEGEFLEEILKDLTLKEEVSHPVLELIYSTNSCCIHVRRGDYLNNPVAINEIGVCPLSYYKRGIEKMQSLEKDLHFFCFSDDIEWCKENFSYLDNITFIENDEANCIIDFYLMTQCKNYIISNSTFSWWASFLSINKDKKVIFPNPYHIVNPYHIFGGMLREENFGLADFKFIIEIPKCIE